LAGKIDASGRGCQARLFAEILNRYGDKIIIRDRNFQIPPHWKRIGGFDHGKTNPTAP
jgi:hypothetical protein